MKGLRALVAIALAGLVLAPVAEAGPVMDNGCPDPPPGPQTLPFQGTRCDISKDTEEFIECRLEFARSAPGMVQKAVDDVVDVVGRDARNAKCLVTRQAEEALNRTVWQNAPVACFVRTPTGCGVPILVCNAVYPAAVVIWALAWPPASKPLPTPCLPPGQLNCVPPSSVTYCVPPYPIGPPPQGGS